MRKDNELLAYCKEPTYRDAVIVTLIWVGIMTGILFLQVMI